MSRKRPSNFTIPKRKKTTIQDEEDDEVPETITNPFPQKDSVCGDVTYNKTEAVDIVKRFQQSTEITNNDGSKKRIGV